MFGEQAAKPGFVGGGLILPAREARLLDRPPVLRAQRNRHRHRHPQARPRAVLLDALDHRLHLLLRRHLAAREQTQA